ncbi:hypothetical protein D9Y22_12615 [Methylorubrum sp. DB1722]|nr:hypothetical protein [Methylorubrum sp. DB1722]
MRIACPGRIDFNRCGGSAVVAARSCAVEKIGKPRPSRTSGVHAASSSGMSVSRSEHFTRDHAPFEGSHLAAMS